LDLRAIDIVRPPVAAAPGSRRADGPDAAHRRVVFEAALQRNAGDAR
jgi:hypothetical protein